MEGNVGTRSGWWFSADRKWRRGKPPEGWQQGPDGRWHSPYSAETEELTYLARTAAAAKRAGADPDSPADADDEGGPSRAAITGFPSSPTVPAVDDVAYPGPAEQWSDADDAAVAAALGSSDAGSPTVFALDPVHDDEAPHRTGDGYADDGYEDGDYADDGYADVGYADGDDEDGEADDDPVGGPGRGSGRHLADDDVSSHRISYGGWPSWARVAAPVAAGVCLLGAIGAAALGSGGSSSDETAGGPTVPTTDTTIGMPDDPGPVTGSGGTGSAITSTTTTAPAAATPPTTAPPAEDDAPPPTDPSDDPSPSTTAPTAPRDPAPGTPSTTAPPARNDDPPEACDPGQGRSLTWYLLNIDPDGDGQICE